jgi:hypothetical protein
MAGADRPIVRNPAECFAAQPVPGAVAAATPQAKRRAAHHPAAMPVDIDIAIGWTSATETRAGGEAGIRKFAQDAIDHTNAALRTTGIYSVTLRLVWAGPVSYVDAPNGTPMKAFEWLRSDGAVARLREETGADQVWLVTFWTEPSAAPVPITVDDFHAGNGIAVVNIIGGVHSAAHEFGHTLGLFHDFTPIEQPPAIDPFPYRYAHYSKAGNFKDIMTPRYKCPECEVWNAFSNASPALTFRGFPVGAAKSDAARLIPFAAERVAAYGSSK